MKLELPESFKKIKISRKFLIMLLFFLLIGILLYNAYFIWSKVKSHPIDESKVISQEEKFNEEAYNQIIEKNNKKKAVDLNQITSLKNPF